MWFRKILIGSEHVKLSKENNLDYSVVHARAEFKRYLGSGIQLYRSHCHIVPHNNNNNVAFLACVGYQLLLIL